MSGDGNTALVGGPNDYYRAGAVWVFTRSGGVWTQQGEKLVGTGEIGYGAMQGSSVALSADGTTAIVGGTDDSNATEYEQGIGAAWVFVASGCTPPSITSQPQGQSIQSGQTAALSVTATGTTPLSYQWYQGDTGDTSAPVGANASTFTMPPLESTTSYWVRVVNACGTADSTTATISVEPRVRRHLQRAP
jgi:hypothetical protein